MSELVKKVSATLAKTNNILVTAESCTGGMIAAAITNLSGSSSIFDRGFVTYSNEAKMDSLGVNAETLEKYGAVSEQTAKEMAEGALKNSNATIAISVTGIAGPTGGSKEKPVGLVYIGLCKQDESPIAIKNIFDGNRSEVREQTVETALKLILENL